MDFWRLGIYMEGEAERTVSCKLEKVPERKAQEIYS